MPSFNWLGSKNVTIQSQTLNSWRKLLELFPYPRKTHCYALGTDISVAIAPFVANNYSRFAHLELLIAC